MKTLEKHNFDIIVIANILNGGKYSYTGRRFHRFFAKDSKSLCDFIINNQLLFIKHIKSKRDKNNKLLIRKNDNFNFVKDFKISQICKTSYTYTIHYDFNHLYFTDCGIITLNEWILKNEEFLI